MAGAKSRSRKRTESICRAVGGLVIPTVEWGGRWPVVVRIIIADDYAPTREMLRLFLSEERGFTVIGEAEDGLRAVELAAELHPDVILMDVAMPRLNGIAATVQVLRADGGVKVITVSGNEEPGVARRAMAAGAYRHLTKPFDLFALSELLKGLGGNGAAPGPDASEADEAKGMPETAGEAQAASPAAKTL